MPLFSVSFAVNTVPNELPFLIPWPIFFFIFSPEVCSCVLLAGSMQLRWRLMHLVPPVMNLEPEHT